MILLLSGKIIKPYLGRINRKYIAFNKMQVNRYLKVVKAKSPEQWKANEKGISKINFHNLISQKEGCIKRRERRNKKS